MAHHVAGGVSLEDDRRTIAFDLSPFARRGRSLWVEGVGELRVQRLQRLRQPWWAWWDLKAEVELWQLPDGRQVRARRQTLEVWVMDAAECLQAPASVAPPVQIIPASS